MIKLVNKYQQKVMQYGRIINEMVEETETHQEKLEPYFTELKAKIEADDLKSLSSERYQEIRTVFQEHTTQYQQLADKLAKAVAPAQLMGNQKLLAKAYQDFTDGCQAMTDSLQDNQVVDRAMFAKSEQLQDDATEQLSKHLQRISSLI